MEFPILLFVPFKKRVAQTLPSNNAFTYLELFLSYISTSENGFILSMSVNGAFLIYSCFLFLIFFPVFAGDV